MHKKNRPVSVSDRKSLCIYCRIAPENNGKSVKFGRLLYNSQYVVDSMLGPPLRFSCLAFSPLSVYCSASLPFCPVIKNVLCVPCVMFWLSVLLTDAVVCVTHKHMQDNVFSEMPYTPGSQAGGNGFASFGSPRKSERVSYSRNVYRGQFNGNNSPDGSFPHEVRAKRSFSH